LTGREDVARAKPVKPEDVRREGARGKVREAYV